MHTQYPVVFYFFQQRKLPNNRVGELFEFYYKIQRIEIFELFELNDLNRILFHNKLLLTLIV